MADALDATPLPRDLDFIGGKYKIPPNRMEDIFLRLRAGASDAEIVSDLRTPSGDDAADVKPILLNDQQGIALLKGLKRLLKHLSPPYAFSPSEIARLRIYRAAVIVGFYTDQCGPAAT